MPELSLSLFGPPRAALDGAAVPVGRRKALALLAMLAVEQAPAGRDRLAAVFWPDEDPSSSRASLRRMLSVLRAALGDAIVDAGRQSVALRRENVRVDAVELRAALRRAAEHAHDGDAMCEACATPLAAAVARCEGEFLDGLTLPDCPAFDEWQRLEAGALGDELASALDRLAAWHESRGELDAAVEAGRRRLALDTLHEPAHVRLIRLHALAGHRASALRQYEECARILEAELGERPGEEATALAEAVRAGAVRPAPARPPARRSLPAPTTPFLGREAELDELSRRLADPACRLVTIVGPGGVGKTRLAVEAAARAAARFPDGVVFVRLSRVSAPALLAPAVAEAAGASFASPEDTETLLGSFLRNRAPLVVLDNFEHLVARSGYLGELLEAAPALKLLVTSRERLGLRGEWLVDLGGLAYPPAESAPDLEAFASVRLFAEAAGRSGSAPAPSDLRGVARVCRLVEGLPLAVELAAAWARVLAPAEIEDEIRRSLDFLASPGRDAADRHRSLRAVFAPSWEMLSAEERDAFARLSVFRCGFGRDAAERVAGATLGVLASLVDKSLVRRDARGRYDVHELLRQLAAERLIGDAAAEARDRHAAFYGEYLDRLSSAVGGCRAIEAVDEELENLRAGWDWVLERVAAAEISRYAGPMFTYYDTRGRFEEGEMTFGCAARALEAAGAAALPTLARALSRKGAFAAHRGRYAEAREALGRAVELLRGLDEPAELALALNRLGVVLHHDAEDTPALERLAESLDVFRALGDRAGEARALGSIGYVLGEQRRYDEALPLMERSLAINREIGDRYATATSLNDLGYVVSLTGDPARARALLEESLATRRALEYRKGIAVTLDNLGYVAVAMGEVAAARGYFRESVEIALEIQAVPVALDAVHGLAVLAGEDRVVAFVRDHPAAWAETREDAARRVGRVADPARDLDEAFALVAG